MTSYRVHCGTAREAPTRLRAGEGPFLGRTALDHAPGCWLTSCRPCGTWGGTEQLSPEGMRVLGQATWGLGEESDMGEGGPATLESLLQQPLNHRAWGKAQRE